MTTLWTILLAWLALSLPFSILVGKAFKRCNEREEAMRRIRIG